MKPVRGYQKKLRILTKSYFEKLFQVAAFCKLLPFYPVPNTTKYKSYKLFTRAHQWLLIYLMEFLLVGLTFMHMYSIISYILRFGIDLYSTIYVIYILIYVSAALFSVTGVSNGKDAVVLLNSSRGCERPTIFSGISWDEDDFLQLFSVQLIGLSGGVTFVCGVVLPILYSNAPWMLIARLPFLDSLPLVPRMAITFVVEYFNILLPAVSCLANAHVFMIGFATIKMTLRRLRERCRTHDITKVFRWTRELELYARVCNTWWRRYFIPSNALVNFGYMLIPLYFSIIAYDDSHLPIYIYASYPAMGSVTLICAGIVYGQLAHIHLASVKLIKVICSSIIVDGGQRRKSKWHLLEVDKEGLKVVEKTEPPKPRVRIHSVCIFGLATRHKLYPLRPVRVENGDFGHYVKIGTGFKMINEVFTYVLILLRLRELGFSELRM